MKRKLNKRAVALLVALVVLLTAAAGATLAFIFTGSNSITNIFQPSEVSCLVVDGNGDELIDGANLTNITTAKVKNTGDTSAYIRVAIVANWVDNNTGNIVPETPNITFDINDTKDDNYWFQGSDGYYYYCSAVAIGTSTEGLIESISGNTTKTGCALSIQVLASAIQAEPTNAVETSWAAVEVDANGKLTHYTP